MSQSAKTRYIMVITMQIYMMMIVMQIYIMDERKTLTKIYHGDSDADIYI